MPKKVSINVYGLQFESLSALCKVLGYNTNVSSAFISKRYGTIEQLIKVRLRVNTDEQAKAKLLELMGQKDEQKEQKTCIDDGDPVMRCAHAYINGLINKGDNVMLDNLALAFGVDRNAVLQAVEQIKKGA